MKVKDDPELMALIQDSLNILDKIEENLDAIKKYKEIYQSQKSETTD